MNTAYLFYGTQLIDEIKHTRQIALASQIKALHGQEIYNGGYVYTPWQRGEPWEWWRCDMTPCRLANVPKELRALALLINST